MSKSTAFDKLAPLLIDAIPEAVASLKLKKPIALLRIYYFDTSAPVGYITLRLISEKLRTKILESEGRSALFRLWGSGETAHDAEIDLPNGKLRLKSHKQMQELFAQVYALTESDKGMRAYRKMIQEVAKALNGADWNETCPVTDDFVVAAADGSQTFADEYPDLVKSIPPAKLKLLRERGLLGAGENWDTRPGFENVAPAPPPNFDQIKAEMQAKAQALPLPKRIAYWIGLLEALGTGADSDLTRIDNDDVFALDRLHEIGADAVPPLVALATRLMPKAADIEDFWARTTAAKALYLVGEIGPASSAVEKLLRQFLKKSLPSVEDDFLAFDCALALHQLFKKYPEPQRTGSQTFADADAFLRVPLG